MQPISLFMRHGNNEEDFFERAFGFHLRIKACILQSGWVVLLVPPGFSYYLLAQLFTIYPSFKRGSIPLALKKIMTNKLVALSSVELFSAYSKNSDSAYREAFLPVKK